MKAHSIPSELSALLNQAKSYHVQQDYPRTYFLYQTILNKFQDTLTAEQKFACELSLFACHLFMNTQDLSTLLKQYPEIKEKYSHLQKAPFEYEMRSLGKRIANLNDNLIDQAKYQLGYVTSVCEYFTENDTKRISLFANSTVSKESIFKSMLEADTLENELKILNNAYQALSDSKTIYESSRQNKSVQNCNAVFTELYEHIADKYADFAASPNCPNAEAALLNAENYYKKLISHLHSLGKEIPFPIHLSMVNMYEELAKCTQQDNYLNEIKKYINSNKLYTNSKYIKDKEEREIVRDKLLSHMVFYNEFQNSKKRKEVSEPEITTRQKHPRIEEASKQEEIDRAEGKKEIKDNENKSILDETSKTPNTAPSYSLTQSVFSTNLSIPKPQRQENQTDVFKKSIDNITKGMNLLLRTFPNNNPSSYQLAQLLREIARFHRKNALKSDTGNKEKFNKLAENLYEASIALSPQTTATKELQDLHHQMGLVNDKESKQRIANYQTHYRQQKFRLFNQCFNDYINALKQDYPNTFHDIVSNVFLSLNEKQFISLLQLDNSKQMLFSSILFDTKNILQKNKDELKSGLSMRVAH